MTVIFNRPTASAHRQKVPGPYGKGACTGNSNPIFFLVLRFLKG